MLIIFEKTLLRKVSLFKRFYSKLVENPPLILQFDNALKQQIYNDKSNLQQTDENGFKTLKIAIFGLPNVGKSTLINRLVRRPVCATSSKVQTTEQKSSAILTENNIQLIFVDTPGIVTMKDVKKYELQPTFISDVKKSVKHIDCAALVQDASNSHAAQINERVQLTLEQLEPTMKTILILNKVDKLKKKKELLNIITSIKNTKKTFPDFSDYFMISALKDDGIDDLREYFFNLAIPRKKWSYQENEICSDPPQVLIRRAVRAKLMDELPNEIPYDLKIEIEHFSNLPDDSILGVIAIKPPSDRIGRLVMGLKGKRIKKVVMDAEQELSVTFRKAVRIKIIIKFSNNDREKIQKDLEKNLKNVLN
ncbi:GTPase Era [Chelonus insularis]|uniref:GTPase Era n=1 Tax=Chelonus insularis TaxID=460826 RepID=UPI0015890853|nr:GTPase Era [Chelonus insularis]